MQESGAERIKFKNHKTSREDERFGLELEEYERMMAAPDAADLTAQQNQETRVATELMRWSGMRISNAHKLYDAEIVANEKGNGWNAAFIQRKTKRRCITPIPDHVVEMLNVLPGQVKDGKDRVPFRVGWPRWHCTEDTGHAIARPWAGRKGDRGGPFVAVPARPYQWKRRSSNCDRGSRFSFSIERTVLAFDRATFRCVRRSIPTCRRVGRIPTTWIS
jgi:integrase